MRFVPVIILSAITLAAPLLAQNTIEQGKSLFELRKLNEAEAVFTAVARANPADPAGQFWLGRIAMANSKPEAAAPYFEKAVGLVPRSSEYHLWLGRAYGMQAMNANIFKQASLAGKVRGEFETAVSLDPANLDARSGLIDYYAMAPGIAGGSVDKAKEQAAEIARRDPIRGVQELARIHEMKKEWAEAERVLADGINRNPSNMDLRRSLGFLYQQGEQWAKAYTTFAAIISAYPDDMAAHYQIGKTAALSGSHLAEGEQSLLKYLKYTPTADEPPIKWAHVRLGSIYEKQKRADLARAEYQQALQLDRNFKEAKEALKKLG